MEGETQNLWQRVTSHDALHAAWHKVHANGGGPGGDGVTLGDFEGDLFANLTQLRSELLSGSYRSGPFRKVSVPKKKPGYRVLTIPSVRDRVLHTSLASALGPIFEPLFEDASFAYRPGRGVVQAVERIEALRRRGFDVVIEADIVSYFDNIDQEILKEKIEQVISLLDGSPPVFALIETILSDQAKVLGTPGTGLVQGSPLSPLLANLHLDALDEEIEAQGVKMVRFADDFVILCKSRKKAEKVLAHCVEVLEKQNLRLHEDGTRIVSFDKGFDFVGYLFLRTLALKEKTDPARKKSKPIKSQVTDEGIIELGDEGSRFDPGKRVLYVLDSSHHLAVRNRSFSVERDDGSELIAIPHRRVGRIEVGPSVSFTRNPVDLALETGAEFSIIDGYGQTKGTFSSGRTKRSAVQYSQACRIADASFRAGVARHLVDARIRNQRTQLMRLNRTRGNDAVVRALDSMQQALRKLPDQLDVDALLGIEGSATAVYWAALGQLIDEQEKPFTRSRPAKDGINAAINYMTGILERDVRAAIQSVGLHPGFAFLHGSKDGHDGLVFDLMEPFRAPLTEGLPVYLFNSRRLRRDMFELSRGRGVDMNMMARRAVIDGYESAVARRVKRPDGRGKLSWRAMMRFQAQSLVKAVSTGTPDDFLPVVMEA